MENRYLRGLRNKETTLVQVRDLLKRFGSVKEILVVMKTVPETGDISHPTLLEIRQITHESGDDQSNEMIMRAQESRAFQTCLVSALFLMKKELALEYFSEDPSLRPSDFATPAQPRANTVGPPRMPESVLIDAEQKEALADKKDFKFTPVLEHDRFDVYYREIAQAQAQPPEEIDDCLRKYLHNKKKTTPMEIIEAIRKCVGSRWWFLTYLPPGHFITISLKRMLDKQHDCDVPSILYCWARADDYSAETLLRILLDSDNFGSSFPARDANVDMKMLFKTVHDYLETKYGTVEGGHLMHGCFIRDGPRSPHN